MRCFDYEDENCQEYLLSLDVNTTLIVHIERDLSPEGDKLGKSCEIILRVTNPHQLDARHQFYTRIMIGGDTPYPYVRLHSQENKMQTSAGVFTITTEPHYSRTGKE